MQRSPAARRTRWRVVMMMVVAATMTHVQADLTIGHDYATSRRRDDDAGQYNGSRNSEQFFHIGQPLVTIRACVADRFARPRRNAGDPRKPLPAGTRRIRGDAATSEQLLARTRDTRLPPVGNGRLTAACMAGNPRDNGFDNWTDTRRDDHDDHQCRS